MNQNEVFEEKISSFRGLLRFKRQQLSPTFIIIVWTGPAGVTAPSRYKTS